MRLSFEAMMQKYRENELIYGETESILRAVVDTLLEERESLRAEIHANNLLIDTIMDRMCDDGK
jgi:hypothetical protein